MADEKAAPKQVKEFFESDLSGREMKLSELLELKKSDAAGYEALAVGIGNGSLTY